MQEPKPNDQRGSKLIILFYILGASHIIFALICCYSYFFYSGIANGNDFSDQHLAIVEMGEGLFGLFVTGLNIGVIILFLYWFRRAYANIARIDIVKTDSKDNMTIWGFVIPILSLFRPYQLMKEVWLKTQKTTQYFIPEYQIQEKSGFILIWWLGYLVMDVLNRVSFRLGRSAETIDEYANLSMVDIASSLLNVMVVFVTVQMIKKIMNVESDMFKAYQNKPSETNTGETEWAPETPPES